MDREVTYDEWLSIREEHFLKYPLPPVENHLRLDIELSFPRQKPDEVPVSFNPHLQHQEHNLHYVCDYWSVIFDVCRVENTPHGEPTLRMLVESGHRKPWGERIRLMSTSCKIYHESWARQKNWNDFALFRGQYWKVTWNENFGDWPGGKVWGLPFQDRRHYNVGTCRCLGGM